MCVKAWIMTTLLVLTSCTVNQPITTVQQVDLDKFMGDWYVIASIPTFIETGAYNAVESYARNADDSISTTFTFRQDSFDGEKKTYRPTGFVSEASNAVWGMQFIWPMKAEYRIMYLNDDYSQTVIGRSARDYVWIMARTPQIADADYAKLLMFIQAEGYDISKVLKVPQQLQQAEKLP